MEDISKEIPQFSPEDIKEARIPIAAHTVIGHLWHKPFKGQLDQAAISWLSYKKKYPKATLEEWFKQFDNSIRLPQREKRWEI